MKMTSSSNFPEDATNEILSRLPVVSLLRFTSVCRPWLDLVKNPEFISKHIKNYNDDHTHLIVNYMDMTPDGLKYDFAFYMDETMTDLSYQDLIDQMPVSGQLTGPYDGVFFILHRTSLTLWNRATKEFRTLPKQKKVLPRYTKCENFNIAFAKDPASTNYKLVFIRSLWHDRYDMLYQYSHVAIYYFSTDNWRDKNEFIPYTLNSSYDTTYLNGVCYWSAHTQKFNSIILSFDMENEAFQEIEGPKYPETETGTLVLYNSSLSMILLSQKENSFKILVMEENRWTTQCTCHPTIVVHWTLGLWKDYVCLVETENLKAIIYNRYTQDYKNLGRSSTGIGVHQYKESLVTFKAIDKPDFEDIPWHVIGVDRMELIFD